MNAYEGKAVMVYLQVKLCYPCLSALRYTWHIKWHYINTLTFLTGLNVRYFCWYARRCYRCAKPPPTVITTVANMVYRSRRLWSSRCLVQWSRWRRTNTTTYSVRRALTLTGAASCYRTVSFQTLKRAWNDLSSSSKPFPDSLTSPSLIRLLSWKVLFRPCRSTSQMWLFATDRVVWSVCLSVSGSVTSVSPAKTTEPTEMPFGWMTEVSPRNRVLDGVQIPHGEVAIFL